MDVITARAMYPYISILLNESERREAEDASFDMEARARGYVPERTCRIEPIKSGSRYLVSRYTCCGYGLVESLTDPHASRIPEGYCPHCGARVKEAE